MLASARLLPTTAQAWCTQGHYWSVACKAVAGTRLPKVRWVVCRLHSAPQRDLPLTAGAPKAAAKAPAAKAARRLVEAAGAKTAAA